jgi:hypothetical protein
MKNKKRSIKGFDDLLSEETLNKIEKGRIIGGGPDYGLPCQQAATDCLCATKDRVCGGNNQCCPH